MTGRAILQSRASQPIFAFIDGYDGVGENLSGPVDCESAWQLGQRIRVGVTGGDYRLAARRRTEHRRVECYSFAATRWQLVNPYKPTTATGAADATGSEKAPRTHGRLAFIFVLLIPLSIVTGWWLGDIDGLVWHPATWHEPPSITTSPGFAVLILLLWVHLPLLLLFRLPNPWPAIICCGLLAFLEGLIVFATFYGANIV